MNADATRNDSAPVSAEQTRYVDDAIASRFSARAFLNTPVPHDTIEQILAVASRAPSGTNMQPWQVYVMTGAALERFSDVICAAYLSGDSPGNERPYYPNPCPEPYLSRRRKVGWDLYGLLDIAKGDKDKMRVQHARNFRFFDAPVGMIITIERVLEVGSWLDLGMFLQNIMVAARGRGLHTCPQAAFAQFHPLIRRELNIPEEQVVVCGMALGHIDPDAPENQLQTVREPVAEFTRFFAD